MSEALISTPDLIRLYIDEKLSTPQIAVALGMSPSYGAVFRSRLRQLGLTRSLSEKTRLQMSQLSPEQRKAQAAAAHAARRGKTDPLRVKQGRAALREDRTLHVGPHERVFAGMLDDAGVGYRQQAAVGIYNLDFALDEPCVAVEIVSGSGNPRLFANRVQRREYIFDAGWHLFEVRFSGQVRDGRTWHRAAVDQLIAFAESVSRDPSAPRKHRVIRPNGRLVKPYMASPAERVRRSDVPAAN